MFYANTVLKPEVMRNKYFVVFPTSTQISQKKIFPVISNILLRKIITAVIQPAKSTKIFNLEIIQFSPAY